MKKCCFRERNYRTFCDSTLSMQKPLLAERFSKMVRFALQLCARALHSASFAIAQDLGRFFQSASSILRRPHPALRFRTENYDEYIQLKGKIDEFNNGLIIFS